MVKDITETPLVVITVDRTMSKPLCVYYRIVTSNPIFISNLLKIPIWVLDAQSIPSSVSIQRQRNPSRIRSFGNIHNNLKILYLHHAFIFIFHVHSYRNTE